MIAEVCWYNVDTLQILALLLLFQSLTFLILKLESCHEVHTELIEVVQIAVGFVWLLVWIVCASFLLSQVPEDYTFGSLELQIWKIDRSQPWTSKSFDWRPSNAFATYVEACLGASMGQMGGARSFCNLDMENLCSHSPLCSHVPLTIVEMAIYLANIVLCDSVPSFWHWRQGRAMPPPPARARTSGRRDLYGSMRRVIPPTFVSKVLLSNDTRRCSEPQNLQHHWKSGLILFIWNTSQGNVSSANDTCTGVYGDVTGIECGPQHQVSPLSLFCLLGLCILLSFRPCLHVKTFNFRCFLLWNLIICG